MSNCDDDIHSRPYGAALSVAVFECCLRVSKYTSSRQPCSITIESESRRRRWGCIHLTRSRSNFKRSKRRDSNTVKLASEITWDGCEPSIHSCESPFNLVHAHLQAQHPPLLQNGPKPASLILPTMRSGLPCMKRRLVFWNMHLPLASRFS